jgi:myo-inositol-1(or 4)-monophosphatase
MAVVELPVSVSGRSAEDVARHAVLEAGEMARKAFRSALTVTSKKGRGNVVTSADVEIERHLRATLGGEFPSFGFLGEESGAAQGTSPYTWVVDPIDGTANFAGGIPHFAVTLALLRDGAPVLGYTYDPMADDLFSAVEGGDVQINGKPGAAGAKTDFEELMLGYDFPYGDPLVEKSMEIAKSLLPLHRVRVQGSAALGLAYVSVGWLDLYYHLSLKPWDVAAGLLLIQESSGGICVDFAGAPATPWSTTFVAGNEALVREFLEREAGHSLR